MKKKIETSSEEIISYYGSLEAYNEEQRRCGLASIEFAMLANPFMQELKIEQAMPVPTFRLKPQPGRFWLKLFGQKA